MSKRQATAAAETAAAETLMLSLMSEAAQAVYLKNKEARLEAEKLEAERLEAERLHAEKLAALTEEQRAMILAAEAEAAKIAARSTMRASVAPRVAAYISGDTKGKHNAQALCDAIVKSEDGVSVVELLTMRKAKSPDLFSRLNALNIIIKALERDNAVTFKTKPVVLSDKDKARFTSGMTADVAEYAVKKLSVAYSL
jgi:hypothetical protein